jgi:hypothetical protein
MGSNAVQAAITLVDAGTEIKITGKFHFAAISRTYVQRRDPGGNCRVEGLEQSEEEVALGAAAGLAVHGRQRQRRPSSLANRGCKTLER